MWLPQAGAMIMPFIITLTRSSSMPWITGKLETPPPWYRLTPGALPASDAVSFVTGALSAIAAPEIVVLLAGASESDGGAWRSATGAGSSTTAGAFFCGVFFTVLAGFGFFCMTSTGGSVADCACAVADRMAEADSNSAAAPARRAQCALMLRRLPVSN